jgi:hypothetical protein
MSRCSLFLYKEGFGRHEAFETNPLFELVAKEEVSMMLSFLRKLPRRAPCRKSTMFQKM